MGYGMNLPMNNQFNRVNQCKQINNPMNNPMLNQMNYGTMNNPMMNQINNGMMNNPMMNQINYGMMNNPMMNQMNYGMMNNPMMNQINNGMMNNPIMNQMNYGMIYEQMNKMVLLMNILMNNRQKDNQMNNQQMNNYQMMMNNNQKMNNYQINNNNNLMNYNINQINNTKNNSIKSNNNQNQIKSMNRKQNDNSINNLAMNNSILSSRNSIYNLANKVNEANQNQNKKVFSDEELKEVFDAFDTNNTGKINPKELIESMKSLEIDKKDPYMFEIICSLDTPEALKKGGISFEDFANALNKSLGDNESEEGIRRIFNLFKDDPNSNVITLSAMKKVSKELGENLSDEELKDMLINASKNGKLEITFEEFYEIMKKK